MSSALFTPIQINSLELPNRIIVAPMCQYSAIDGSMTDWHLSHLGQIAMAGPALIIIEATGVEPEGRITHGCTGLYSEENEAAMRRVINFCREVGHSRIAIQLNHAGRKASSNLPWKGGKSLALGEDAWQAFAPSAVPISDGWHMPQALDEAGLARIREAFIDSTRRAARLGLDAVELHAAHGYLLHTFLSPVSNKREDQYGGSFDNRVRFPLEILSAVRKAWPAEKPLIVRLSATDWIEGGWSLEQSIALAPLLEEAGCDVIHVSSGGVSPHQQLPSNGPGYQTGLAAAIRQHTSLPVIAVGMITDPVQAEHILTSGQADMVALAREFLRNPRWVWQAAQRLGGSSSVPPQYLRAQSF